MEVVSTKVLDSLGLCRYRDSLTARAFVQKVAGAIAQGRLNNQLRSMPAGARRPDGRARVSAEVASSMVLDSLGLCRYRDGLTARALVHQKPLAPSPKAGRTTSFVVCLPAHAGPTAVARVSAEVASSMVLDCLGLCRYRNGLTARAFVQKAVGAIDPGRSSSQLRSTPAGACRPDGVIVIFLLGLVFAGIFLCPAET